MDFKIKIDLASQSIINETPKKDKKKRKREGTGGNPNKMRKKLIGVSAEKEGRGDPKENKDAKENKDPKDNKDFKDPIDFKDPPTDRKKKHSSKKRIREEDLEKPRINSNSIISLTLPNNENSKGDQAQKLSMITKKKPRHWEKRWVLIPNVFEFTKEIWLKKWVLVDEDEDISENNVNINFEIQTF